MWKLKQTKQCAKCPWKKSVNPHDIPNGYSIEKHKNLSSTIASADVFAELESNELKIMTCHNTEDNHCVGWLHNQMGVGNNILLRLSLLDCENISEISVVGEQHACFSDTLPDEK